ncbi:MAG: hypothetical protein COA69_08105 [Robiginitomaculum sp.]|nr:MAG: hypothetical protein COA69_08105 [Robiginitomaculum sp.]
MRIHRLVFRGLVSRSLISRALISSALAGVFVAASSTAAYAGCSVGVHNPICDPRLISHPSLASAPAPIHIYGQQPYGYLKQFAYKNTPNVNIMRLHSRAPLISLGDRPVAFTNGCMPSSTVYCRAPQILPAPMPVPAPYIAPPTLIAMPQQYRQTSFATQSAHIAAPAPSYSGNNGYWEKASGPALIDGLPVSQILCRRAAPCPVPVSAPVPVPMPVPVHVQVPVYVPAPPPINVRVVRPIIGVPVPVPTPIAPPNCNCFQAPAFACGAPSGNRYGNPWTY